MIDLDLYMADLENRICPETEDAIWDAWMKWIRCENTDGPFAPPVRPAAPSKLEWPHILINDALDDVTLSVYRELESVHRALNGGSCAILRIRPNFGVCNLPSTFGLQRFLMKPEQDTLPNIIAAKEEDIPALIAAPMPGLYDGNFGIIAKVADVYADLKKRYPRFARYVHIEQPDLQSPLDNLELIWGSSFFYALYDDPDMVHAMLAKLTAMTEQYMDHWVSRFPQETTISSYFSHVDGGAICVRSDSAMNLSPEMYQEFIAPYDGRLLAKYGGIVHFCGRGDHYIDLLTALPRLHGINMSQPHLNDMDKIFASTIDRGIHLSISAPVFPVKGHDLRNLIFM